MKIALHDLVRKDDFRHKELTYEVNGLVFEVRNKLKGGWPEEAYHQALFDVIAKQGFTAVSKEQRSIKHRDSLVHTYEADITVEDILILELKVLRYQRKFSPAHFAQIIHYLKLWQRDLGLLVNFGPPQVHIKRVIWDEPEVDIDENYDYIKNALSLRDKRCLREIRHLIRSLAEQFGLGYPDAIYRRLLEIEAKHHQIPCVTNVRLTAVWENNPIATHTIPHLLLHNNYLVHICAVPEFSSSWDLIATKTYLQSLGKQFGLVANFNPKQLQIRGINAN
ncbi:MAG: GxxExxY protein [Chloroflexota bacterium]